MKPTCLLLVAALCLPFASAAELTESERATLLEKLEAMRANANSKVDARYRLAIAAYQSAMASDQAAIDLYLNCVEKVNFTDQKKKNSEFRDWKKKEADKLSDPGMGLALRIQLRWLILTLRAASEKADREELATGAREVLDTIVSETEKLKHRRDIIDQSATSSLYARAYDIGDVKVENWVFSPGNIGEVYEKILMPPLRSARNTESLRSAWLRRINQEIRVKELLHGQIENTGEKRRIGMASDMRSNEVEKFMTNNVPQLQWSMEVDLFRHGDERNAAIRMLAQIEKNIGSKSAVKWTAELIGLLTKKEEPAAQVSPGEQPQP